MQTPCEVTESLVTTFGLDHRIKPLKRFRAVYISSTSYRQQQFIEACNRNLDESPIRAKGRVV